MINQSDLNEPKKFMYTCPHIKIITEHGITTCLNCGMEIIKISEDWTDDIQDIKHVDNQYCLRKSKIKNIYDDIQYLHISQHIKDIANEIYQSICENTRRGVTRKGIIFGCVFHAYKMDQNPQTHEKLIELFKIKKKDALNGLKFIHKNAPKNSKVRHYHIDVEHIIVDFLIKFGAAADHKTHVLQLYKKIQNTESILNRSRPQSIASALIYYYITEILHKPVNMKVYTETVKLSELTIQKICKVITKIVYLFRIAEYIQNDDIENLKIEFETHDPSSYVLKKTVLQNKLLTIEKYIEQPILDFAIECNSVKCVEYLKNTF